MRYGIKSITMDDVARELSMSKKTLYQYVTDKDDLVKKTILLHIESMDTICSKVFQAEENAIDQTLNIAKMMISMHKDLNPGLLFDLKKFHPESYRIFVEHKDSRIRTQIIDNLNRGIEQNLYRKDIHIELTASFYISLIENCLNSEIPTLDQFSFPEKYDYLVHYHLYAICTPEGIAYMKNVKTLDKSII
jgi:AcrR family transcriptional regulator